MRHRASLQRAYKSNSMKSKFIKMNGWEQDLFDIIEWENFGIVFCNMTETDKIQLFNMSHGILPVMYQKLRFEYATSNMCPICNDTEKPLCHAPMLNQKHQGLED